MVPLFTLFLIRVLNSVRIIIEVCLITRTVIIMIVILRIFIIFNTVFVIIRITNIFNPIVVMVVHCAALVTVKETVLIVV